MLKDSYATPQRVVDNLVDILKKLKFTPTEYPLLDVCASEINRKAERFISEEEDTLTVSWGERNICWMNPPYSNVMPFIKKAVAEMENNNYTIALLKCDPSTKWFKYALQHASVVMFVVGGRINFLNPETNKEDKGNVFASVVFVFGGQEKRQTFYLDKERLYEYK